MLPMTREDITKVCNIIIDYYQINIPIIDIIPIVKSIGGKVILKSDYPLNGDVRVVENKEYTFEIHISDKQNQARLNNAIACLLGHVFLHMGYLTDNEKWTDYKENQSLVGFTEYSFQAQEFADNLLMPKKDFLDYVYMNSTNDYIDIVQLSRYFCVSRYAANNRGKWLGVMKWR
ncbi:ImmA/IrrE family metallo-endopeptidase [Tannockella kyphosi]|uniref:ImmA/IrrE family metallo-endopeptidase n=1 Tax=Tannockella kyphosi TaxID=2899121 RepID=UPI00201394D0|nr:ImmA/IrrE family metallo-endopeptidase [Tannockella kyphosi]